MRPAISTSSRCSQCSTGSTWRTKLRDGSSMQRYRHYILHWEHEKKPAREARDHKSEDRFSTVSGSLASKNEIKTLHAQGQIKFSHGSLPKKVCTLLCLLVLMCLLTRPILVRGRFRCDDAEPHHGNLSCTHQDPHKQWTKSSTLASSALAFFLAFSSPVPTCGTTYLTATNRTRSATERVMLLAALPRHRLFATPREVCLWLPSSTKAELAFGTKVAVAAVVLTKAQLATYQSLCVCVCRLSLFWQLPGFQNHLKLCKSLLRSSTMSLGVSTLVTVSRTDFHFNYLLAWEATVVVTTRSLKNSGWHAHGLQAPVARDLYSSEWMDPEEGLFHAKPSPG